MKRQIVKRQSLTNPISTVPSYKNVTKYLKKEKLLVISTATAKSNDDVLIINNFINTLSEVNNNHFDIILALNIKTKDHYNSLIYNKKNSITVQKLNYYDNSIFISHILTSINTFFWKYLVMICNINNKFIDLNIQMMKKIQLNKCVEGSDRKYEALQVILHGGEYFGFITKVDYLRPYYDLKYKERNIFNFRDYITSLNCIPSKKFTEKVNVKKIKENILRRSSKKITKD